MAQRRLARRLVLESLYRFDLVKDTPENVLEEILSRKDYIEEVKEYSRRLLRDTVAHLGEIDREIKDNLQAWKFERLSFLDKALLRLATCELLYYRDIPNKVSINEAVEIARFYGTEGAAKFINAVLDTILKSRSKSAFRDIF